MKATSDPWLQCAHHSIASVCSLPRGAAGGQDFLVNCPVDLHAQAIAWPGTQAGPSLHHAELHGKVMQVAQVVSGICGIKLHHELRIDSSIPRGKGMASSTADLTAAVEALRRSCDVSLTDEQLARVLTAVKPSDCVHFPGIAHVNHLNGDLLDMMPAPRGMRVLVLDCGGEVDTVRFDRERARAVYRRNQPAIRAALHLVELGLLQSAASLAQESSNTVIVKSMGKSLGWHGIRLGHAVANRHLAARMRKKLPYWNINGLASFVLKNLSEFRSTYQASFQRIAQDREALLNRLRPIEGLATFPSAANFLYCELGPGHCGAALSTRLLEEHGILARERGNKLGSTKAHLRFAVRPKSATDRLGTALEQCLGATGGASYSSAAAHTAMSAAGGPLAGLPADAWPAAAAGLRRPAG